MTRMTLDQAVEAFKTKPNEKSAAKLLTVALIYWHDEMIGDESFEDEIILVRDWLARETGV